VSYPTSSTLSAEGKAGGKRTDYSPSCSAEAKECGAVTLLSHMFAWHGAN
jgi:hypothetical protein